MIDKSRYDLKVVTKYFQVMKSGLSYELDSDIHHYHHFKIGELIVCDVISIYKSSSGIIYKRVIGSDKTKWDELTILDRNTYQGNKVFTLNWDSVKSKKISIIDAVECGYLDDVTKSVEREWKLELIGV